MPLVEQFQKTPDLETLVEALSGFAGDMNNIEPTDVIFLMAKTDGNQGSEILHKQRSIARVGASMLMIETFLEDLMVSPENTQEIMDLLNRVYQTLIHKYPVGVS